MTASPLEKLKKIRTAKSKSPTTDSPTESSSLADDVAAKEPVFYRDLGEKRLDVDDVQRCPDNPRKEFDPVELQKLADSIVRHGQQQNVTVRKMGAWFELISGERRWRAIQLTTITHINCKVVECDDKTAIELRGEENFFRKDFNPIEEAVWFKQMIESCGYNQTTLGEHLKINASQVSNRLRLLKLPEEWQQRVIDGSLPGTHARSLVPWADRPSVLDKLANDFHDRSIAETNVKNFETAIIGAVMSNSRSMTVGSFSGPKFEVTDELTTELDIVDVPEYAGATKTTPRAFNITLWDHEQADAITEKTSTNKDNGGDEAGSDHVSQAAESQSTSSGSKEPEIDLRATSSRLGGFEHECEFIDVFARAIADQLAPNSPVSLRMFLTLIAFGDGGLFINGLAHAQDRQTDNSCTDLDAYELTNQITSKTFAKDAFEFVRSLLQTEAYQHFTLGLVRQVASELDIDPMAKWQPGEELLELCSTIQLRELFTDEMADAKKLAKWDRKRLKKELLEHWPEGYLPMLLTPTALLPSD